MGTHAPAPDIEAPGLAAQQETLALGVGAVMALHGVDRAAATTVLGRAADRFEVSVSAVAHALLALVAATDEQVDDEAGRAASQVLVQGFVSSA